MSAARWLVAGILLCGCDSSDERRAQLLSMATEWSRTAPVPPQAGKVQTRAKGGMFSRGVEVSFRLPPKALDTWLQASPGLVEAGCATGDNSEPWSCDVKPGGGAQKAVVTIDRSTGVVHIRAYWS